MTFGASRRILNKREQTLTNIQRKIIEYKILHNKQIITDNELQNIILGKK